MTKQHKNDDGNNGNDINDINDRDWETKRFAVTIACYRYMLESPFINSRILEGFQTVMNYSLCCFKDTTYDDLLKRTLNITMTYVEFIRMFKKRIVNMDSKNEMLIINDACNFIIQRFPAINACNDCGINDRCRFERLHNYITLFTKKITNDYELYSSNTSKLVDIAKEVHTHVEIH